MLQKKDPLNLTGKVAVVTGGSSGIGLGVVELLSAYGAKVAMVDISPKGADKAKELQDAGREVEFFQCDVTSEASVMAAVKAIVDRWGKIDILHNNAGVTVRKTMPDLTEKEWDFVLDVGLKGLFLFSKHVIPVMEANGGGSIINTGSGWGLKGGDQAAAYCAVKGGIVNVTRAMAIDHGPKKMCIRDRGEGALAVPAAVQEVVVVQDPKGIQPLHLAQASLLPVDPPEVHALLLQGMVEVLEISPVSYTHLLSSRSRNEVRCIIAFSSQAPIMAKANRGRPD